MNLDPTKRVIPNSTKIILKLSFYFVLKKFDLKLLFGPL